MAKLDSRSIGKEKSVMSSSQIILNNMFGGNVGKRVLGDTRPKLNRVLNSGGGLIKNGDDGYTASLMLPTKLRRRTL